jgi:Transcription termination factor nusG
MAALERHWYVVYTKPQKEDYAELNLRLRGVETFFPKLSLPKPAQRKRQIVSLFPNYLFVRFQSFEDEYYSVTWCPGVKRLVSFDSVPAAIDDSIVSFLRCQMGSRCNVKIGQQVSIVAEHSMDLTPSFRNRRTQRDESKSSWSFLTAPPRSIFQLTRLKSAGLQLHPRIKIRLSVNSLMANACHLGFLNSRPSGSCAAAVRIGEAALNLIPTRR